MPLNIQDCPDPETLANFVLGKLPTDDVENCRQHLVNCDPCVDTIRGLKVDGDTIHELSKEAWQASGADEFPNRDQDVVDDLMSRMEELSVSPGFNLRSPSHVLEDRAAEVQRLLEPAFDESELGQLGKYRILELLGAGSTGVVYLAIDQDLDRTVALKVLRPSLGPSARERFIAEARATAKLQHPNVVQIFEVAVVGSLAIISMMWEPGQTLEQRLAEQECLATDDVIQLGLQLSSALAHAHSKGLIHRDIKPANVWIPEEQGVVACRILDFGLVRITDEDPQLTCTGMIAGTPCYMSPEQSRGQSLDGRSDLFSLGCVMYQSLTGQLPFRSDNALSTLQSIQRDQPAAPLDLEPTVPQDLSDLIMCLLEKSPRRRPPYAEAVVQALSSPRNQWPFEIEATKPKPAGTQPVNGSSRRIGKYVATLLVGLGLGILGLMFGPHITSIVTDHGTIEINSHVDDVKIEVLRDGKQIQVVDLATKQAIYIKSGNYEIRPLSDANSIQIANNVLTLTRGEKEIVTITRLPNTPNQSGTASNNHDGHPSNVGSLSYPATASTNRGQPIGPKTPYRLAAGDVLGVFVEGVLGTFGTSPPVHMPPAGTDLPPSLGFPVMIESDGNISLPLVKPISVDGMTVSEATQSVVAAFREGPEPILKSSSRIMVSLMRRRDPTALTTHRLDTDDVIGVFIEGVLGDFESAPPVHIPELGDDWLPSMGYPIVVRENGSISLPLIQPVSVRGKTIAEARQAIAATFTEGETPILNQEGRILVSLMRKRSGRSAMKSQPLPPTGPPANSNPTNNRSSQSLPRESPAVNQPVYHEKTYDQWIQVARNERDLAKTLLALKGMANLATKSDLPDTVEAFMQVVRRGSRLADPQLRSDFSEYRRAFFASLTADQQTDLLCREITSGNQASIQSLTADLRYRTYQHLDRNKQSSTQFQKSISRLVDVIDQRYQAEESQEVKRAILDFYSEFDVRKSLTSAEGAQLKDIYQDDFQESLKTEAKQVRYPIVLAKLAPETPGIVDHFKNEFKNANNDRKLSHLITAAQALPPEQSRQLIPTAIATWERLDAKQFPSAAAAEYFLLYPKECAPYLKLFQGRLPRIQKKGPTSDLYQQLIDKIKSL